MRIDFLYYLCYNMIMAEEKQTPARDVAHINLDDIDVLRYVLQNVHGIAPVSIYSQADFDELAE